MIGSVACFELMSWVFHSEVLLSALPLVGACGTTNEPVPAPTTTTTSTTTTTPGFCSFTVQAGTVSGSGVTCQDTQCNILENTVSSLIIACPNNEVSIGGVCSRLGLNQQPFTGPVSASCTSNGGLSLSYSDICTNSVLTASALTSIVCQDCPECCFLDVMRTGSFDVCAQTGFTPVTPTNNFGRATCTATAGTILTLSATQCTDQLDLIDSGNAMGTEVATPMGGFTTFTNDAIFTCSGTTGLITINRSFANGTIAAGDAIDFIDCAQI